MQVNQIIEEINIDKQYIARPLEHKGFNRHYVNLINAEVFSPKKLSIFSMLKNIFLTSK